MKFTSQEEYGLRCLLRIANQGESGSLTIPEISLAEGITQPYAAKLMRVLRQGGFVKSARGQAGGYTLARQPERITVGEVIAVLGGRLFELDFCDRHAGNEKVCTHSVDCSIRSLWRAVQLVVDQVLGKTTLMDLIRNEREMSSWVNELVKLTAEPKLGQNRSGLLGPA
jgi:Rrf2 family protein